MLGVYILKGITNENGLGCENERLGPKTKVPDLFGLGRREGMAYLALSCSDHEI